MGLFKRYSKALFAFGTNAGCSLISGGNWDNGSACGVFCLNANNAASNSNANIGARLMFLSPFWALTALPSCLKQALPLGKTYTFQNNVLVVHKRENSIVGNTRTAKDER